MKTAAAAPASRAIVDAWYLVDGQGRIVGSDFAAKRLGAPRSRPAHLLDIVGDASAEVLSHLARGEDDFVLPFRIHAGAGEHPPRVGHIHVRRFVGNEGVLALVAVRRDEPDLVYDALTGLPDRRALAIRMASWQAVGGDQVRCAVLFVDLNQFKQVNDLHGHAAGDGVLATVGRRLTQCVREGDLVVRYGGDEFVLLLKDIGKPQDALPVIDRIHRCVNEPIQLGPSDLRVSAAVGLAIVERHDMTLEEAIAAADQDMYTAKRRSPK